MDLLSICHQQASLSTPNIFHRRVGGAAELAGLPLKTHHNTFIYQQCILHTFSTLSPHLSSHYLPPLLFCSILSWHFFPCFSLLIIWREIHPQSVANKTANNNSTMQGKRHATDRCNYNMPSILHLSFYLPNLPSLSLSPSLTLSCFLRYQQQRSPPSFITSPISTAKI